MSSDLTIKYWVNQEKVAFDNFTDPLASRFEEGWCAALVERLRQLLAKDGHGEVKLPWGTYTAEIVAKGEAGNINCHFEPSKGFIKILNNDMDTASEKECISQDEFDEEFQTLFRDYVAYGMLYPNDPKNKDRLGDKKCVYLEDDEVIYFLNSYALMLATIAKDKQRDGKIFRLEINDSYPHGVFDFEYDDDEIKVKWVADKVFKQMLKDDAAAAAANGHDFTEITETRKEYVPAD